LGLGLKFNAKPTYVYSLFLACAYFLAHILTLKARTHAHAKRSFRLRGKMRFGLAIVTQRRVILLGILNL
jgi:hypothetical protein